jgi:hypothetical protein
MENWRFGSITEDKKIPVRFLDSLGNPWPLSGLSGYGVKLISDKGKDLIRAGINLPGYNEDYIKPIDDYSIYVTIPGTAIPRQTQEVYGVTVISIPDVDMPSGNFIDISDEPVLLFKLIADYKDE